jgi:hypothetical protein
MNLFHTFAAHCIIHTIVPNMFLLTVNPETLSFLLLYNNIEPIADP